MDGPPEIPRPRSVRIGPDQVTISDLEVVIEAKHEMPDWQVREFKVIPIYFEDKRYFLAAKQKIEPPFAFRYVLRPWPQDHIETATFFHSYDAQAVAERDSAHWSGRREEWVRLSLLPFYPFLGFLWSGAQRKLIRFGFAPQTITGVSIFTGFSLMLLQGAFVAVMVNASGRAGTLMLGGVIRAFASGDHLVGIPVALLDCLLLLGLLVDAPVRYSLYLKEEEWAGGFLEWLAPRFLRKK